jgi:Clp amino terminal domain, pathogenicity island component
MMASLGGVVPRLSYSAQLAWQFAAEEAVQSGSEFIEPVHLLVGILNLEKIFSAGSGPANLFTKVSLEVLRVEWTELMNVLIRENCTPSTLRAMAERKILPGPCEPGISRKVSRSPQTRSVFALADQLAENAGSSMTGLIYLLAALFEYDTAMRLQVEILHEALSAACRNRLESPASAFARNASTSQSSALPDMQRLKLALAAKRSAS